MRSRAVSFPRLCWRSTAASLPACRASSRRADRSAKRCSMECSMTLNAIGACGGCRLARADSVAILTPTPPASHSSPGSSAAIGSRAAPRAVRLDGTHLTVLVADDGDVDEPEAFAVVLQLIPLVTAELEQQCATRTQP